MKTKDARGARTSRRTFTKAVAAAIVAAPVAAGAQTTTPAPKQEPKAPPNPQPAQQQQPAKPSPVAEAYAEVARARFGGQISDEDFKRVKRDLEGSVRNAERLASVKLNNWDEPDFIFNA